MRKIENGKLKMERAAVASAPFFNFQFSIFNSLLAAGAGK